MDGVLEPQQQHQQQPHPMEANGMDGRGGSGLSRSIERYERPLSCRRPRSHKNELNWIGRWREERKRRSVAIYRVQLNTRKHPYDTYSSIFIHKNTYIYIYIYNIYTYVCVCV